MPPPSPIPGVIGPPVSASPALLPVDVDAGGSGGAVAGQVVAEVQGVCVAFDSPALTDTPLWTRLDDPAGPFVVSRWEIDGGRAYELDKTGPGTATVTIIDTTGAFDPTNVSGPFYGKLQPMKPAAIALRNPVTGAWSPVFTGFVAGWKYDMYVTEDYVTVTLELVDGFDLLAAAEMTYPQFGIPNPLESLGDIVYPADGQVAYRINRVLDDAGWPAGMREIFSGNVAIRKTVYPVRSPALTVIQDAADAEFPGVANVFVRRDGWIVFHGRFARFRPDTVEYDINVWRCGDTAAVQADPTRSLIFGLTFARDKTNLINSALVTPQGIDDENIEAQLSQDAASVAAYGTRSVSFENLLTLNDYLGAATALPATKKMANYYRDNYATPRTRVSKVTFKRVGASDANAARVWAVLCGVDISDILRLKTTHAGGGGFDNEDFYVEGLHYTCEPLSAGLLDVTLDVDVSPRGYYTTEPT